MFKEVFPRSALLLVVACVALAGCNGNSGGASAIPASSPPVLQAMATPHPLPSCFGTNSSVSARETEVAPCPGQTLP